MRFVHSKKQIELNYGWEFSQPSVRKEDFGKELLLFGATESVLDTGENTDLEQRYR